MIRRLGPGDEAILAQLARDDAEFDLDDRSEESPPLSDADAAAYLADANVVHWIDVRDDQIAGFLVCHVLRLRSKEARELVLYEIGVHRDHRRRGVGRGLVEACLAWMRRHAMRTIWVLADNAGAEAFYEACGFVREAPQPVMFIRTSE